MRLSALALPLMVPGLAAIVMGSALLGPQSEHTVTKSEVVAAEATRDGEGRLYSRSGHDITPLPEARIQELAKDLTDEERRILLKQGTEAPFCGTLLDNKKQGTYLCRLCELPLFTSDAKFDSGSGWPSFFQPVDREHVGLRQDNTGGMRRTEIVCNRCSGHLGHVFDDAPQTPTGLRFCLNSASLGFVENGDEMPDAAKPIQTAEAIFGGGCFWGVEDHFQKFAGVINVVSGYQGGEVDEPTYKQVCSGRTGHAEVVRVTYDPAAVSYRELLEWFFTIHNPTTLNRQGPDVGTQYRSAIYAADTEQLEAAKSFIAELQQSDERFKSKPIVTEVKLASEAGRFWPAEQYHQDYHEKHGGACPLPQF